MIITALKQTSPATRVQFIGVVATFAYTAIATYIILKVVGMMVGLRVSPEEEQQGLDISAHEEIGARILKNNSFD
jgi:ammonia channel protein AmtB